MKITETTAKYILDLEKRQILIEETKNEKGEKIYSISEIKTYTINDKEWSPKTDDAKNLDRNNIPDDLKKVLRKVRIYI
ncbi:hypothetical protein DFR86_08465 [Acidianus sulfidivorans JP7]|uniref:Uncharacterized protein n=1 Tax=Acidianus sulfidivorans JP7 TaxID=619593 RepID=A0A2U9INJ1_9CREN|nr:hypothetical protein [Acidianus sulfidivorans]AWR97580.1 hypothetical protein DFR86_08465 [Acidianus sulfidivorans JP7]